MRISSSSIVLGLIVSPASLAQQAIFDAPVEITAGGSAISNLLYPSPVLFDVDGDSQRELILGDLFGNLWSCEPLSSAAGLEWGPMQNLQCDGQPLRLHNW